MESFHETGKMTKIQDMISFIEYSSLASLDYSISRLINDFAVLNDFILAFG